MATEDFIRVSVKDLQSMAFTPKELKTIIGLTEFYITVSSATTDMTQEEIRWILSIKKKRVLIKNIKGKSSNKTDGVFNKASSRG